MDATQTATPPAGTDEAANTQSRSKLHEQGTANNTARGGVRFLFGYERVSDAPEPEILRGFTAALRQGLANVRGRA